MLHELVLLDNTHKARHNMLATFNPHGTVNNHNNNQTLLYTTCYMPVILFYRGIEVAREDSKLITPNFEF